MFRAKIEKIISAQSFVTGFKEKSANISTPKYNYILVSNINE
jgi:hypothetical protein